MDSINIDQVDDLMGALSELPLLKIRRGYVLDVFEEGDSHGSRHMPYCHTEGAYEHYYPTDSVWLIVWHVQEGTPDREEEGSYSIR